jgi:hypothetical protein
MQELQNAVVNAFAKILAAGVIEQTIEDNLTKTIKTAIDENIRSYSDFGKTLSDHVKQAMQVDFQHLGLPAYNDLILKTIRRQVNQLAEDSIAKHIEDQMKELLEPAPTEIKLSQLVADFIKDKHDHHGCVCDGPERIALFVEGSRSVSGYHHISLDKDEDKSRYSCAIQIATAEDGRVFSLKIDDDNPKDKLFVGPFWGFERRLFQMYAAGTKLIVDGDEHSIDRYYPGRGD